MRRSTEGPDISTEYGLVGGEKQLALKAITPENGSRSTANTVEEQVCVESRVPCHVSNQARKCAKSVKDAEAYLTCRIYWTPISRSAPTVEVSFNSEINAQGKTFRHSTRLVKKYREGQS